MDIKHLKQAKLMMRNATTGTGRIPAIWKDFANITQGWLQHRNVLGAGIGAKLTDGVPTGQLALRIYVNRKLPKNKLTSSPKLHQPLYNPTDGNIIPVDVIGVGAIKAHGIRGGSIITGADGITGRIGCLVRRKNNSDRRYILSNAHVLGLPNQTRVGDPIKCGNTTIATFTRSLPLSDGDGYPNLADVAIAEVTAGVITSDIWGEGNPTGTTNSIQVGQSAVIGLEEKGTRSGLVRDINAHVRINYSDLGLGVDSIGFDNLVACDSISGPGDSGSIVLDTNRKVIGLLIGGSDSLSFFCKFQTVMNMLDVELIC